MAITKISPSVVDFDSALVVSPTLTIGDATAEDTKIVFDGNAQDYYIGLDDSADDLIIGKGSAVGTTPAITIDANLSLGISTTPNSGWSSASTSGRVPIQIGAGSISGRLNDNYTEFSNNCYASGTGNDPQWSGLTRYAKQQIEFDANGNIIFKNAAAVDQSTFDSSPNFSFSDRMSLDTSGNVTISDGNLVVASGHGIDFSATSNGSGTSSVSELLDDYEEGTWTPAISSGTATFSNARYTKIGRLVRFSYQVQGMDDITSNNHILVTGLPFPVQAGEAAGVAFGTYTDNASANVVYATDSETVYLYSMSSGTWDTMLHSELNSNGNYQYVAGTYQAES